MNGESIVSVSQIMVKQQGLKKQKQTNHGTDHEIFIVVYLDGSCGYFNVIITSNAGR
jgi:hypothetical protein